MKRMSLWIDQKQLDALARIKLDTGAPAAESIRRAINEYVARHARKEARQKKTAEK